MLKKVARQGGVTEIVIVPLYISCPVKKKSGTARGKGGSNLGLQPTMEVPYHSASSVVTLESLRFR